jgi:outer membrane protein assembly factor BamB
MRNLTILRAAVVALALVCIGPPASSFGDERVWTDNTGQHKIKAEFAGLEEGKVSLRKADGVVVQVPLDRLSDADRRWVIRHRRSATDPTAASALVSVTTDWPRWRGPNGDGISGESGLLKEWDRDGPSVSWSSAGLGSGYSSVAIYDGKIFTMGKKRGSTNLICVSAKDGSAIWEVAAGGGGNPNCTPTVDPEAKLVFGLAHDGKLVCADIETGQKVWSTDFQSDFGGEMMSGWGYSESPLVDGDRLICTPGSDSGVLVALNKRSGEVIWKTTMTGGSAAYSSPVISHAGGVKQYVTLVGKGLIGVRASDGQLLWHYPRIANKTANVPTPIVQGDLVFGSSGYGDGGSALLRISAAGRDRVRMDEVYYKSNNEVQNHHGGMILIGQHIYMGHGHNKGLPLCMEMQTGRVVWGPQRGAGSGSAAIVAADGHLYFRYENAVMALIEATPAGYTLKGSFKIKSNNGKSWAHPVIFDKKLYLRDQDELHCYNIAL